MAYRKQTSSLAGHDQRLIIPRGILWPRPIYTPSGQIIVNGVNVHVHEYLMERWRANIEHHHWLIRSKSMADKKEFSFHAGQDQKLISVNVHVHEYLMERWRAHLENHLKKVLVSHRQASSALVDWLLVGTPEDVKIGSKWLEGALAIIDVKTFVVPEDIHVSYVWVKLERTPLYQEVRITSQGQMFFVTGLPYSLGATVSNMNKFIDEFRMSQKTQPKIQYHRYHK